MPEELLDEIADHIVALFSVYHRKLFRRMHGVSGIQIAGFRVLGVLVKCGNLSISEIGRHLYISKPYMTRLIDDLIGGGFVERQPDAHDRRVIRIHITDSGKKHLRNSGMVFRDDLKEMLSQLEYSDLSALCESLENLHRILGKIDSFSEGGGCHC
jgi:DNA-binding MarR family transcriptional regulator